MRTENTSGTDVLLRVLSIQPQLNNDVILTLENNGDEADHFSFVHFPQLSVRLPVVWCQQKQMSVYFSAILYSQDLLKQFVVGENRAAVLLAGNEMQKRAAADWLVLSEVAGLGHALGFLREKSLPGGSQYLLLDANADLPVRLMPSSYLIDSLPAWVTATLPLLEDWHIPARVASSGLPGCYDEGFPNMVQEFRRHAAGRYSVYAVGRRTWLDTLDLQPDIEDVLD